MPHSFGLRARSRKRFQKGYRQHGAPNLSTYLTVFKLGDIVDVKANPTIQKGMPHRIYHGKTGRVWDITPRSVGVEVLKRVREKLIVKRFHIRTEHVRKSRTQESLKEQKQQVERLRGMYAARNEERVARGLRKLPVPRIHRGVQKPAGAHIIRTKKIETVTPSKYELLI